MEQLRAAVENGADAAYMGGRLFNARRNAENFGGDEMRSALEYAHARGVNVYVTMNTLISDAEMQAAVDAAFEAYEAGADALIVQDLGLASVLRKHIPDFPLHLSTQGTIAGAEGIKALAPLGFSRVILARELSLGDIRTVAAQSPVPVEVFAHGALCVCYSGQCLMSSMIGSRSGNRGMCAQPCRLPYRLGEAKGYLLSPKDLCALELLPELAGAGVSALKIEGRMKSAEYVAIVTSVYRKYLDRLASGEPHRVEEADMHDLKQAFNRGGFTTGYLTGRPGRALICRERPKHWGVPVGTVIAHNRSAGIVEARLTAPVSLGDGIEVVNAAQPGNIVTYIAAGGAKAESAGPGRASLGYVGGAMKPGDEIVKTSDKALNERARASFEGKPHRKAEITGEFYAHAGDRLRFSVWDGDGNRAIAESALPAERARTLPLDAETARAQLMKTGDSPFTLAGCRTDVDGQAAARLSELNALRREALGRLEDMRARRYSARACGRVTVGPAGRGAEPADARLSVYLYRWRDDLAGILRLADRVYAPFAPAVRGQAGLGDRRGELFAWLPPVSGGKLDAFVEKHAAELKGMGLDGVLVGNAEHIGMLKGCGLPLWGDASLNAFNGHALSVYAGLGLKGIALSHELTMAQIEALPECGIEKEAAVYGRIALMASAHCPVGAEAARAGAGRPCGLCAKRDGFALVDRTGAAFPVLCDGTDCRSTILNADVLAVPGLAGRLSKAGVSMLRLCLYDETPEEAERILRLFRRALNGETIDELRGEGYTKGHYFREV